MAVTIKHAKTDTIADWTQADLDAQIALGNFPPGTLLADIVLPSDWNNDHTFSGTLPVANGGTGKSNTFTDGQLLIGNTSTGGLDAAVLTAGAGIGITNNAGSILIANTGGGGGGVSGVTASAPLASSGGSTPNISISSSTGSGAVVLATGATQANPTISNYENFTPITAPTYTEGRVWYDSTEKALAFYNDSSALAVHVGQDLIVKVINNTGSTIPNGSPVYVTSTSSGQTYPNVALAKADVAATSAVIGLTNGAIANGAIGYVTSQGIIDNVNTSTFTVGQVLYLSPYSAGQLMNTIPPTGITVQVGVATFINSSTGHIYVKQTTPLSVPASIITGQVALANGGTNANLTAVNGGSVYSTGSALAITAAGTSGQVLTSSGAGAPTWTTPTTGTVTSITAGTGLSGGTITSSGTIAIDSTVATLTGSQVLTNKSISGSTNTLSNIGNASLTNSAITINGTSTSLGGSINVGTVTSVTGTSPVVSSGGATPAISMAAASSTVNGYLTSTDWNTFNNKGSGTVTSVTATSPVTSTGGATPVIAMPAATTSVDGYLTSTDWTTFNNKGSGTVTSVSGTGSVNGITLTGTVTSTGSLTLGGTLGSIANSQLTNSSVTVNGTAIALGASGTVTATATNALTIGSGLSGTSYNGSTAVTIANSAPMTYPTGSGIAVVSSGTSWGTTLTAPSGAIVGTTDTQTLTNKRVTPRVSTTTSSATPTINTDNVDFYGLTAQAANITSFTTNLSGTPTDGQKLWIYIVGTAARTITWGASFEASTVALPTTTVTTNRLDVGFVWNAATSKWRCVAVA